MKPAYDRFPITRERRREMEREADDEQAAAAMIDTITGVSVDYDCRICGAPEHKTVDCPQRTTQAVRVAAESAEEKLGRERKMNNLARMLFANRITSEQALTMDTDNWAMAATAWNRKHRKSGEKQMGVPSPKTREMVVEKLRELEGRS